MILTKELLMEFKDRLVEAYKEVDPSPTVSLGRNPINGEIQIEITGEKVGHLLFVMPGIGLEADFVRSMSY